MVENVFGEPRVLGRVLHNHQPCTEEMRQDDEKHWHPTVKRDRQRNGCCINREDDPGVARDF